VPASDDYLTDATVTNEPPPFLRTWHRVYIAVLLYLTLLILTLYVLTRIFAA
jgi:hypothetical protein